MSNELKSTIQIDGVDYEVTATKAETAAKVEHKLAITVVNGTTEGYTFDGSDDVNIEIKAIEEASHSDVAEKIRVNMGNEGTADATITISKDEPKPTEGSIGDIWFKHN